MTPEARCPGNELNKTLETIDLKCAECGAVKEIFGDEKDKNHTCAECGADLQVPK